VIRTLLAPSLIAAGLALGAPASAASLDLDALDGVMAQRIAPAQGLPQRRVVAPPGRVVAPPPGRVVRGPPGRPVVVQRRGRGVGAGVAAGVLGAAAGAAIIGGALAQPDRRVVVEEEPVYVRRRPVVVEEEPVVVRRRPVDCTQFRSYDPSTGTFIDRNGIERQCD
jgi:hypothetical protein